MQVLVTLDTVIPNNYIIAQILDHDHQARGQIRPTGQGALIPGLSSSAIPRHRFQTRVLGRKGFERYWDWGITSNHRMFLCTFTITHTFFRLACTSAIRSSKNLSPAASLKSTHSPSWPGALILMVNWWFCSATPSISCPSFSIINYPYNLVHSFKSAYFFLG